MDFTGTSVPAAIWESLEAGVSTASKGKTLTSPYLHRLPRRHFLVVAVVAAVHFAFIGYLVLGGFLALRWPRTIWLHVPTVVWGVGFIALKFRCPLTELERWARKRAGMGQLAPGGFMEHYITGVWYPAGAAGIVQIVVFSTVGVSWAARVLGSPCGDRGKEVECPKSRTGS